MGACLRVRPFAGRTRPRLPHRGAERLRSVAVNHGLLPAFGYLTEAGLPFSFYPASQRDRRGCRKGKGTSDLDKTPDTTRPRVCLIVNRQSGRRDGAEHQAAFRRALAGLAERVTIRQVRNGRTITSAARAAVAEGFDTVVVAGGDGTVAAAAQALTGTDARLGVVPLGTFNFFARGLGIPEETDRALDVIHGGHARSVTLGEVNGQVFINNAGLGIYPAILLRREAVYRRWGRSRLAAYWSVIRTIATVYRPLTLRVTVDGTVRRLRTPLAFVANSAYQLEQFQLEGTEALRDDEFALYLATDCGRLNLIRFALRLARGALQAGRDFELMRGREIRIETRRRRCLVARDGEMARLTRPFVFQRRPGALKVLVPPPGKVMS